MPITIVSDRPTAEEIGNALAKGATSPPGYEAAPDPAPAAAGVAPSPCGRRLADIVSSIDELRLRVSVLERGGPIKPLPTPSPIPVPFPVDQDAPVGNHGAVELRRINDGDNVDGPVVDPTPPVVVIPPVIPALSKNQGDDPVAHIGYMRSTATLSRDGRLSVSTTTWSVQDLAGFTGGVFVVAYDANGSIPGRSTIHQFGVDGKWVPWSQSSRTGNWSEDFGVNAAVSATWLGIVHLHAPHPRFFEDLAWIVDKVISVAELIAKLCAAQPLS